MARLFLITLALVWLAAPRAMPAQSAALDEGKIRESVRKALSIPTQWTIQIKDLAESPFPNFYQAALEFQSGKDVQRHQVLISKDGRYYILGRIFETDVDMDAARRKLVSADGSPVRGDPGAPVTIVEFSDLQCASCKQVDENFRKDGLLEIYPGKVRLVLKDLPLPNVHPWALQAAVACRCAWREDPEAFWQVREGIFAQQAGITPHNLRAKVMDLAKSAGLDLPRFGLCYDGRATLAQIERDIAEANSLGIGRTPTFLVNGRLLVGYPGRDEMKRLIDEFLAVP